MALPPSIRVKLSSEAAEYVALTPVVVRELPSIELLEHIVSATGPSADRVIEILKRGSIVSGATRYRWERLHAELDEVERAIAQLPGPEPGRPFNSIHCMSAWLCGPGVRIQIAREAGQRTRFLRRSDFWTALLREAAAPDYVSYAYKERADLYRVALTAEAITRIADAARLLPFTDLAMQIRNARISTIELLVRRAGS